MLNFNARCLLHAHFEHPRSTRHMQDTVVVDSTGSWLADWSENYARMACTHFRTPITNSPHKQPAALLFYAKARGREQVAGNYGFQEALAVH